ncbi:MAG: site-specific DNA-methyltransferase [Chloroflexi bacterium]|nr:site-specific DNA-methyltransferase [Chloroflexota bacterium]
MGTLYYGDNLDVLRSDAFQDASIDLVYLDPPFNSKRDYNLIFKTPKGRDSEAQIIAFEDSWHWGEQAEREYEELLHQANTAVTEMIRSFRGFLDQSDMMAYLVMMANRLLELRRVLKPTGSLYLHCDPTASHYLKVVMDTIFGPANFVNEIVWHRYSRPKGSQFLSRRFGASTDSILFYGRSENYKFHADSIRVPIDEKEMQSRNTHLDEKGPYYSGPLLRSASMGARPNLVYEYQGFTPGPEGWRMTRDKLTELDAQGDLFWTRSGIPRRKVRPKDNPGRQIDNLWADIEAVGSQAKERQGYPTQKPLALLERIIQASSDPGDLVLDPFCGCGTAVHAAEKLGRNWIGIDITHLAIGLIERRLRAAFPEIQFDVHGVPKDLAGARDLAARDKYEFQWWACSLVGAQPYQNKKKGPDAGIDGLIYFQDDQKSTGKKIVVSVKGGEHVGRTMIADLKNSVEREGAQIGLFVTLAEPTEPMELEALSGGFYESPMHGAFRKIQILTIAGLLAETQAPRYPDLSRGALSFRKAPVEQGQAEQKRLVEF